MSNGLLDETARDGEIPGDDAPQLRSTLNPPKAKGRASVVRLPHHWFILATSEELGKKPIARMLMGTPLVLFRDGEGKPGALLDRCPHRNVPLSAGRLAEGRLECVYHGWQFNREGACMFIPSLAGAVEGKAREALAYPAVEEDGFIWVYPTPIGAGEPKTRPYVFPHIDKAGYTTVRHTVSAEGTMHAAIENALDVPHTAFLHRGLFRSKSRGIAIEALVTRTHDRVVAEYIGEPRPPGLVGRMLSPSGGMVTHYDRFILPSIAEVEYRIGDENHFVVTTAMTPVSDFFTKLFAVVTFKTRVPGAVIKPFLFPIALKIFSQDAKILRMQTDNIHRFGGEQFASTEIDVLGRHIWRLMKAAERGDIGASTEKHEERVVLRV